MPFEVDFYVNDFSRKVDEKFALVVGKESNNVYASDDIDQEIGVWIDLFNLNAQIAQSNFVKDLQYDMVYGDENWTPRERFQKQRQHLNGALAALTAIEASQTVINDIDAKLEILNKPITPPRNHYTPLYNEYINQESKEFAKNELKDKIKEYSFRGYGKRQPLFITGMAVMGLGLFALLLTGILALTNYNLEQAIGEGYGTDSLIIGIMAIAFSVLTIAGLAIAIPAFSLMSEKKKVQREVKELELQTKAKLKKELQPIVNEYNNNYYQVMLDADSNAKQQVIDDYTQKRADMVVANKDAKEYFHTHYSFAEKLDWDTLHDICEAMRNGLADSYSSALRYVLDEQKKALQREQDLAIKREEMRMQAEHNRKMEHLSQEQLAMAQRQAIAAENSAEYNKRAAYAAEQQKEYAKESAYYAKETAKAAKKTNNILTRWDLKN